MIHTHLLSLLIWIPVFGAALVLLLGNEQKPFFGRVLSLGIVVITLLLCIPLYKNFDITTYQMQFVEKAPWIPSYGINYFVGVDGISMPLVILTVVTSLIVILAAWRSVTKNVIQYLAAALVIQGMITGVFAALDSILFYVFWEATLIPMFLMIGIWGSENRIYAAIKFFLFTLLGSLLMLIALLYLGIKQGDFSIQNFYAMKIGLTAQIFIFIAFFTAFAVKVPMWPVHTWLPDAHTEAPAGGSVILAALMLKMGTYGFLRFNLPITPDASQQLSTIMIALSLIAIIYIAFVAIAQTDMKRLIAYSSIAHMGFVTLATFLIFALIKNTGALQAAALGIEGGIILMISHAFVSGALFLGVGVLYDRLHTRQIRDFGGVAKSMPVFAMFFMLFAMANVGLPGTSGFVGEFMVILSSFQSNFWIAFGAATTLILAASYTLWMYKRVIFGAVQSNKIAGLTDLNVFEKINFTILALFVLWLGIYPAPLLNVLHASVQHLLEISMLSKL